MRKPFLDNARGSLVLLVIVYHAFYLLNSVGVIRNVDIAGIPAFDALLAFVYPWFMTALFAIAGASARYALERKGGKAFLRAKLRRVLLPSIAGNFLVGWIGGFVTLQYQPALFGDAPMPGFVRYIVLCLTGIGPLWFLHELFLCDLVVLLLRRVDRRDALGRLGERAGLPALLLLTVAVFLSAQVLNTPVMEVYRNGIYVLCFLLGYEVLCHERVQTLLVRAAPALVAASVLLCAAFAAVHFGESYCTMRVLRSPLACVCAWIGTLAVFAGFGRWANRETRFTRHMRQSGFAYYVLHLPLMLLCALALDRGLHATAIVIYPALLVLEALLLPPLAAILRRIPVLKTLLLGL